MKKIIYLALLGFAFQASFSQNNWQKGGNNSAPAGSQPTIGTNNLWNSPLNIITNGVQRMTILGSGGGTDGFVGIGQSFLTPQNLLHLNMATNTSTFAQFTNSGTGSTSSDGFLVGATGGFLNGWAMLNQQEAQPMWFLTGGYR